VPAVRVFLPAPEAPTFEALRRELGVVEAFPSEALEEAAEAAAHPRLPSEDLTALPFLTIDPVGSVDLDQAMHLVREGAGVRLRYAIADLSSFVVPHGALDVELRRRGETLYAPDRRVPLHPPVLGEDAASLLPGVVRPAVVWDLLLDPGGEPERVDVRRALVRSRRRLDYGGVQADLDAGTADEQLVLLREVGLLRQAGAAERGALDLPSLEQEVDLGPAGPVLSLRAPLPAEGWNAQVSLLTGSVAARTMLAGGVGLLRTMPDPDPADVEGLRRSALALGLTWPAGASYAAAVSAMDPHEPRAAALLVLAARLLRGAGYTAFDGAPPEQSTHSAVAGPYAHATAPLRRLADRYVLQTCVALHAGEPVPYDVRAALPLLPAVMTAADRAANALDRAGIDLAEALVLAPHVGERFAAQVVETGPKRGVVQLREPAVRARCDAPDLPLGARIDVELVTADPATRTVRFRPAGIPVDS
jgi:exoribonuclease R